MATKKEYTAPHVVGHAIEHNQSSGERCRTAIAANVVHDQLRLEIAQGSTKFHILAKDWEFFKKQADELLGKRRLIESTTK